MSCRLLFQFEGVISAQTDVILTGNNLILNGETTAVIL